MPKVTWTLLSFIALRLLSTSRPTQNSNLQISDGLAIKAQDDKGQIEKERLEFEFKRMSVNMELFKFHVEDQRRYIDNYQKIGKAIVLSNAAGVVISLNGFREAKELGISKVDVLITVTIFGVGVVLSLYAYARVHIMSVWWRLYPQPNSGPERPPDHLRAVAVAFFALCLGIIWALFALWGLTPSGRWP